MNRNVVRGATAIALALMTLAPAAAGAQEIKVTLLGTGTTVPARNRFGPSILVEAAGQKFLFDAGRGALQRLAQLRALWEDVDAVFRTHPHWGAVVGFPDVWLPGWLVGPARNLPRRVLGARGTTRVLSQLKQAYEF